MQLNAYLLFNGRCAEAFKFYEQCLGGTITTISTFKDSPMAAQTPPDWGDKIIHARLMVGIQVLMGSDAPPGHFEEPKGFSVSIGVDQPAEADRIFAALADGGTVTMPIQETFWATRFGMLVDRFGTPWMVNCEQGHAEAAVQDGAVLGASGERELVLTRILIAPRERVFAAWTDPAQAARWWGPKGFSNPVCEIDARPDGALRIVMRSPDGAEYPMTGIFREVVAPERLVFSNLAVDHAGTVLLEGLTVVTFAEHTDGTKLTLHTRAKAIVPMATRMLDGMEQGWSESLGRLQDSLSDT